MLPLSPINGSLRPRVGLSTLLLAAVACSGGSDVGGPSGDPRDDDPYPYPVGKVFFSHAPVGLDGVAFFESMGALFNPYQQDHGGFHHREFDAPQTTTPVLAPADGQVIEIRTHTGTGDVEHAVRLKVSTTIELLWGHVGRLSGRLASAAPQCCTGRDVRIPVQAGEVLGYVAKTPLDLAVNDLSRQAKILHPEFRGVNAHSMPLEDYYHEPLKSQIRDLALREAEPRTGIMGYDVAGTLSGLWYLEGSNPAAPEIRYDIAFHFGYDHLFGHRSLVLDGLAWAQTNTGPGGISLWTFWIKGNPRMEDITPASGLQTFEMYVSGQGIEGQYPDWRLGDISGLDSQQTTVSILLVEMLDDDTIRLERFDAPDGNGISPADVPGFTAGARVYHRDPTSGS